ASRRTGRCSSLWSHAALWPHGNAEGKEEVALWKRGSDCARLRQAGARRRPGGFDDPALRHWQDLLTVGRLSRRPLDGVDRPQVGALESLRVEARQRFVQDTFVERDRF